MLATILVQQLKAEKLNIALGVRIIILISIAMNILILDHLGITVMIVVMETSLF